MLSILCKYRGAVQLLSNKSTTNRRFPKVSAYSYMDIPQQLTRTFSMKTETEFLTLCMNALKDLGGKLNVYRLQKAWAEYALSPNRKYHDKNHILHVVAWIEQKLSVFPSPKICLPTIFLAALYHDVVYEIDNPKNEELSAKKASSDLSLMGVSPIYIARVVGDIMCTCHKEDPETMEGKYMADADLASFILPIEEAWQNTQLLHIESGKSAADFARGNAGFLKSLLERPRIYYSPYMDDEEKIARQNIALIIKRLNTGELKD